LVAQLAGQRDDDLGIDVAFVGTAKHGRQVRPHGDPSSTGVRHDVVERGERVCDRLVDVLLVVRLRRTHEHRDLLHTGGKRRLEAAPVRHERAHPHTRGTAHTARDLDRVRELRDPLRRHEARDLDVANSRRDQRVDEADLLAGRDLAGLVLQAVARPDLVDRGFGWQLHDAPIPEP
jgi:hypothetical protein